MERNQTDARTGLAPVAERDPQGLLDSPRWAGHATFTVEEVAEILRLTRWGAYEAVKRGDIPAIRFGRTIRVGRRTLAGLLGA